MVNDNSETNKAPGLDILSRPAEEFVNDENIEFSWAVKAFEYAEVHYNLLASVDTKYLQLTPIDGDIYATFRETFPDMKVDVLDVDFIKSPEQKQIWRELCEKYKNSVEDYNFGTLIRIRSDGMYDEENTVLVPRIQFFAIEIARNKEGHNDAVRQLKGSRTENRS